jgi:hypothetical protein
MGKKLTQEEFVQKVNEKYNGKYEVVGEYIDARTPIKIKHTSCGTVFPRIPNNITAQGKNTYCPVCDGYSGKTPLVGINDLWTTHPEVAKMLKNKEDGYKCSYGSCIKKEFLCKYCNETVSESVYQVVDRGYISCPFCSSGKSYPNRFMANLLKKLKVEFIPEYIIPPHSYKFDFYFIINKKRYVVEMDGGIGHSNKTYYGEKDYIGEATDLIKDNICHDNNIEPIRIDCNYEYHNRFDYIKESIVNSKLNTIFDLNNINFRHIDELSSSSLVVDIANYWKSNIKSYQELNNLTSLCRHTIRKYLKEACEKNFITEPYDEVLKEIRLSSNKQLANTKGIKIMCDQTGEIFYSIASAEKQTGVRNIKKFFNGERSYAGKLPDGTKLTWTKISNEQYEQMLLEETS